MGLEFVERGAYELVRQGETMSIDASSWREKIIDGCTIWMNIVVKQSEMERREDSRQCPRCRHLCDYASLGNEVTWYAPSDLSKQYVPKRPPVLRAKLCFGYPMRLWRLSTGKLPTYQPKHPLLILFTQYCPIMRGRHPQPKARSIEGYP
jgi:hypothetical protein